MSESMEAGEAVDQQICRNRAQNTNSFTFSQKILLNFFFLVPYYLAWKIVLSYGKSLEFSTALEQIRDEL